MNEQEERENVIKGLECAIEPDHYNFRKCHSCQYRKDIDHLQYVCDSDRCIADAIELINKTCVVKTMCENSMGAWYQCECGASVEKGDVFCRKCGGRLAWEC